MSISRNTDGKEIIKSLKKEKKEVKYIKATIDIRDFEIKKDSVHKVVPCPKTYIDLYENDIWIYCESRKEPIRLMGREYEFVDKPKNESLLSYKVLEKLKKLELDESFDIKETLMELYGIADFFTRRSFDVLVSHARKDLKPKKFRAIRGRMTRINP